MLITKDRRPAGSTTRRLTAGSRALVGGRRVLDVCSYVGAWAVRAAKAAGATTTAVDVSARHWSRFAQCLAQRRRRAYPNRAW